MICPDEISVGGIPICDECSEDYAYVRTEIREKLSPCEFATVVVLSTAHLRGCDRNGM